jgi:hypothetical protein
MSPYYIFIPSDTELFPLAVGDNVNNIKVGRITLYVEV